MGHPTETSLQFPTELLIDQQLVKGQGPDEPILNPATGDVLCVVPEASQEQVNRAVSAAHRAFETWSQTTPGERAGMLLRLADAIEANAEQFARKRYCLRVISGRMRDDATRSFGLAERGHRVVGAAKFERTDALKILTLKKNRRADFGIDKARLQHRRAMRDALNTRRSSLDVCQRWRAGVSGYFGHGVLSYLNQRDLLGL